MKILFIYPNIHTPYSFSPAIQQLSAILKKAGHETALIHINNEHGIPFEKSEILKEYLKIHPNASHKRTNHPSAPNHVLRKIGSPPGYRG